MFNVLRFGNGGRPSLEAGTLVRDVEILLVSVGLICMYAKWHQPSHPITCSETVLEPVNIARDRYLKTKKAKYSRRGACDTKKVSLQDHDTCFWTCFAHFAKGIT